PRTYIFWNALSLYEMLCILIVCNLLYANWLFKFSVPVQIAGHVVGVMVHFLIMGTFSYYREDYVEGYVHLDNWKDHLLGLLKWKGLHFHDQYIITVGVYYVIRYFQRLENQTKEKGEIGRGSCREREEESV